MFTFVFTLALKIPTGEDTNWDVYHKCMTKKVTSLCLAESMQIYQQVLLCTAELHVIVQMKL